MSDNAKPVGIFDSGIGGLTVLHAIGELLPGEDLVYLGDTARVPYGTKSRETVIRYSLENSRFLLDKNVKAVVVACNSASATSMEALREKLSVPVVGVIEAGAEEAIRQSRNGAIGVIGTNATISSGRYDALLQQGGAAKVLGSPCPLFVPLAEEGWTDNDVARQTAAIYLQPFTGGSVDTLILGCTHYPLLQPTIAAVLGPDVTLINSAQAVAKKLKAVLEEQNLLNPSGSGKRSYYVTDSPQRAEAVGSRFLGEDMAPHLELADLTPYTEKG